jgi:hypothetical protein
MGKHERKTWEQRFGAARRLTDRKLLAECERRIAAEDNIVPLKPKLVAPPKPTEAPPPPVAPPKLVPPPIAPKRPSVPNSGPWGRRPAPNANWERTVLQSPLKPSAYRTI